MKQSANALKYTGLAGAVAVAGASQAYGTMVSVTPPSSITGHAANAQTTTHIYWNPATGVSTTAFAADDINFGYYNNSSTKEFFTGLYINAATSTTSGGGVVGYYASNGTEYAYGLAKGSTAGTGGSYATFNQKTGYFSILSLTYNGSAYAILKPNGTYYVGFQFTDSKDGLLHDGWVELQSNSYVSATNKGGLIFIAAGINNTADSAGGVATIGSPSAVPEPGTLSALALGAAALTGVGLKRRRKAALASAQV